MAGDAISFGPFSLIATERLLMWGADRVELNGRALDLLIALTARPNEIIAKKDLISQVWPDVTVEEGSLRFHMAALRKTLGDGVDGARYIVTAPGRGYSFVAAISAPAVAQRIPSSRIASLSGNNLPAPLLRMVGRTDCVRLVTSQLMASRFVSVVGPGGVGKTTVAVAAAHEMREAFGGEILFADLASISEPDMVAASMASILGVSVQAQDPTALLISLLRNDRFLLILDNCEHVVDAIASLAERVWKEVPEAHILATSREALRVEGERVYRLPPLAVPLDDAGLSADMALKYPSVALFVERATANDIRFTFRDEDAATVAGICRKLDGVALAIELAAARVAGHGLRQTATLLDERLSLMWLGRRTAPPRQKTLQATLDWSYDLLSGVERIVLRRLGILVAGFTLDAAKAIAINPPLAADQVSSAIDSLIAKSMIVTVPARGEMRYRLLETTRAYARAKLTESGEADQVARRHALYYRTLLEYLASDADEDERSIRRTTFRDHLGNVRAALEWTLIERGDLELGVELTVLAAMLYIELALLSEYRKWIERSLELLPDRLRGGRCEMELQAGLGHCLMFTRGNGEQVEAALLRATAIAQSLRDSPTQLRVLTRLHMYNRRAGNFEKLLPIAQRVEEIAAAVGDPVGVSAANLLLGVAKHLIGDQSGARQRLEAALAHDIVLRPINANAYGFHGDPRIPLARVLWLQGDVKRAVEFAARTTAEPLQNSDPVVKCIALIWGISVFRWTGSWDRVAGCASRLIECAKENLLEPFVAVGEGMQAELTISRGDIDTGQAILERSFRRLRAESYELYTAELGCSYARSLLETGRSNQAFEILLAIEATERERGGSFMTPETLRLKAECLIESGELHDAADLLKRSAALAARQSALSWQLRTAVSFVRLAQKSGSREQAWDRLEGVVTRFPNDCETPDLAIARTMIAGAARLVG